MKKSYENQIKELQASYENRIGELEKELKSIRKEITKIKNRPKNTSEEVISRSRKVKDQMKINMLYEEYLTISKEIRPENAFNVKIKAIKEIEDGLEDDLLLIVVGDTGNQREQKLKALFLKGTAKKTNSRLDKKESNLVPLISSEEVEKAAKKLRSGKAFGLDGISAKVVKALAKVLSKK